MKIKHKASFKLFAYGKNKDKYQIRLRVTFNAQRMDFSTGCQIYDLDYWDENSELVRDGYAGPKGETSLAINNELRNIKEQMETTFKYFEVNDIIPTTAQVVEHYEQRLRGTTPRKPEPEPKKAEKPREPQFFEVYQMFLTECGEKNAWTNATFEKMAALKEDLTTFKKKVKFSDLDEAGLTAFVRYLREEKVLKTPRKKKGEREDYDKDDIIGLKNSSIEKKLGYLRWFLNWTTDRGYNTNLAYKTFRPTLKMTQKKVIYLSKEELQKIKGLELKEGQEYLDPVRDVFLFCCFTGLRHSDVSGLRRNDVKGDHIEVTTVKTADSLSIELNDVSKAILEKYKEVPLKDNYALPVYTNQAMNRNIKELCKLAGIDEEIRVTTYKGNERKDEIHPKWELVGTHTGRRTFIVNALSLGIPPNVVMKWTGHNDYKAMKPYIDIVDSIRASEMTKMNLLCE